MVEELEAKIKSYDDFREWETDTARCIATIGNLTWYLLQCMLYGFQYKKVGDFHFIAKSTENPNCEFNYIERDCVLTIKK